MCVTMMMMALAAADGRTRQRSNLIAPPPPILRITERASFIASVRHHQHHHQQQQTHHSNLTDKRVMAFHHGAAFFTLVIFLWLILASAHASMRSRHASEPIRPTRQVKQRAFQNLDLLTARGYGKRIPEYAGGSTDTGFHIGLDKKAKFNKQALMSARLYGKRAAAAATANNVNNLFMEWMNLQSRMHNNDNDIHNLNNSPYSRSIRDDEILLPDE